VSNIVYKYQGLYGIIRAECWKNK